MLHTKPEDCLDNLEDVLYYAGRAEWLEYRRNVRHIPTPDPTGDCAVVTLAIATNPNPDKDAYEDAYERLRNYMIMDQPHKRKSIRETNLQFAFRRIREIYQEFCGNYEHINPLHKTNSKALYHWLFVYGYHQIYGPEPKTSLEPLTSQKWTCICDPSQIYVIDIILDNGGHASAIVNGFSIGTAFLNMSERREIIHVWRMSDKGHLNRATQLEFQEKRRQMLEEFRISQEE